MDRSENLPYFFKYYSGNKVIFSIIANNPIGHVNKYTNDELFYKLHNKIYCAAHHIKIK